MDLSPPVEGQAQNKDKFDQGLSLIRIKLRIQVRPDTEFGPQTLARVRQFDSEIAVFRLHQLIVLGVIRHSNEPVNLEPGLDSPWSASQN